jgi:hypothetical protein
MLNVAEAEASTTTAWCSLAAVVNVAESEADLE